MYCNYFIRGIANRNLILLLYNFIKWNDLKSRKIRCGVLRTKIFLSKLVSIIYFSLVKELYFKHIISLNEIDDIFKYCSESSSIKSLTLFYNDKTAKIQYRYCIKTQLSRTMQYNLLRFIKR